MTKHETERIEKLLYADLAHNPRVEEHYGKASHDRIAELFKLLIKAKDQLSSLAAAS